MKKTILLSIALFSSMIQCSDTGTRLGQIKEKWISWGNTLVAVERDRFLGGYGLDSSCLGNADILGLFKSNYDRKAEALISSMCSKPKGGASEVIEKIATEVFKDHGSIKILHDPESELDDVGVFRHYESGVCYIVLNCEKHLDNNLEQLKEILWHEYSHVIHEDTIGEEFMQYMAWANSEIERAEIEKQTLSFHKAFETRADIYAAVNSASHGQHLIDFFKRHSEKDATLTHPETSDRIALLEKIKLELNLAATEA